MQTQRAKIKRYQPTEIMDATKDYRLLENRFEGFDKFYKYMLATGDWSPDINVERWMANDLDFDFEKRCVMAFFHGATYAGPCESMFADRFPKITYENIEEVVDFYVENKKRLLFSPDCKYRKIVFEKFLRSVGEAIKPYGSLGKYIEASFSAGDDFQNYNDLQSRCMTEWYHWGRMGHWCFAEALWNFVDAPIEPPTMEFKTGKSHRSGWAFCIGRDDLTGDKVSQEDIMLLEQTAADYIKTIDHPDANFLTLETCCCNYKRQHKGSRYGGCYIDEQHWEMEEMKKTWPEYNWLWDKYLEGRKSALPNEVLGELHVNFQGEDTAYVPSWNKALKDYGRIPRVEAFFNKKPQIWMGLNGAKKHWHTISDEPNLNTFFH